MEKAMAKPTSTAQDSFEMLIEGSSVTMRALVSLNQCAVHANGLDLFLEKIDYEQHSCQALNSDYAGAEEGCPSWRSRIQPRLLAPKPVDRTGHQKNKGHDCTCRSVHEEQDEQLLVGEANTVVDPRAVVIHAEDATVASFAMVCPGGLPSTLAQLAKAWVLEHRWCRSLSNCPWIGCGCTGVTQRTGKSMIDTRGTRQRHYP